jgi:hypothetical protein
MRAHENFLTRKMIEERYNIKLPPKPKAETSLDKREDIMHSVSITTSPLAKNDLLDEIFDSDEKPRKVKKIKLNKTIIKE